jgi:hypothetical protein
LTEDLDVFVEPTLANARRLRDALADFAWWSACECVTCGALQNVS